MERSPLFHRSNLTSIVAAHSEKQGYTLIVHICLSYTDRARVSAAAPAAAHVLHDCRMRICNYACTQNTIHTKVA